jgi:hypothetical protein
MEAEAVARRVFENAEAPPGGTRSPGGQAHAAFDPGLALAGVTATCVYAVITLALALEDPVGHTYVRV